MCGRRPSRSKFWLEARRPNAHSGQPQATPPRLWGKADHFAAASTLSLLQTVNETGDGAAFFAHIADDVDWTVMGTYPLAGHYRSKADYAGTFAKLGKVLPQGAQLHVEHVMVKDDEAVVELRSLATAINGMRFDNCYCMVLAFDGETIVRGRSYLDFGDGGASVRGKSNRVRVAHLYVVFRSKRGECRVCDPADPARMIDQELVREPAIARCEDTDAVKLWRTDHKFQS